MYVMLQLTHYLFIISDRVKQCHHATCVSNSLLNKVYFGADVLLKFGQASFFFDFELFIIFGAWKQEQHREYRLWDHSQKIRFKTYKLCFVS